MKTSELMIGDWVMSTHPVVTRPIRVKEIYDRNVGYKNGELHMSFIEPIPITPEILEKNGFIWNDLPLLQCWEQYGLMLYISGNGYGISCGENVSLKIDYVHQLQHALRLVGVGKEVAV